MSTYVSNFLDKNEIQYKTVESMPVTSCVDVSEARNILLSEVGKCIVFSQKDKQWDTRLYVTLLSGNRFVSIEKLESVVGHKVKAAKIEKKITKKYNRIKKGCIAPPLFYGIENVDYLYDSDLLNEKIIDISSGFENMGYQIDQQNFSKMSKVLHMQCSDIAGTPKLYPGALEPIL